MIPIWEHHWCQQQKTGETLTAFIHQCTTYIHASIELSWTIISSYKCLHPWWHFYPAPQPSEHIKSQCFQELGIPDQNQPHMTLCSDSDGQNRIISDSDHSALQMRHLRRAAWTETVRRVPPHLYGVGAYWIKSRWANFKSSSSNENFILPIKQFLDHEKRGLA